MENVKIVGRHIDVTDAIVNYVKKRISHLDKYLHKITSLQVILDVEKYRHSVEVVLHSSGKTFSLKEIDDDLYTAIDKAADRLKDLLRRYKEKIVTTKKHRQKLSELLMVTEEGTPSYELQEVVPQVMKVDEAVKKFDSKKEGYLPFIDKETGEICFAYRDKERIKVLKVVKNLK